ncbi:unnamed protein product, partial [Didymodactylos carnosus]
MRRFLVWPSSLIWPGNLPFIAVFRTLSEPSVANPQWKMTRLKFFVIVCVFQFIYHWFPGFIMPILGAFSWMCMIKPNNLILSQLTGINGLGLGALQLNWNLIRVFGSPIIIPWWAQVNCLVGFIIITWIFIPIAYYSNLWSSKLFPIVSSDTYAFYTG